MLVISLSEVFVHDTYIATSTAPAGMYLLDIVFLLQLRVQSWNLLFSFLHFLPPRMVMIPNISRLASYFYPAILSYSYFTTTSPSFKSFLLRRRNGNPFHIKVFSIKLHDCTFVRKGTKTPFSTVVAIPTRTNPSER